MDLQVVLHCLKEMTSCCLQQMQEIDRDVVQSHSTAIGLLPQAGYVVTLEFVGSHRSMKCKCSSLTVATGVNQLETSCGLDANWMQLHTIKASVQRMGSCHTVVS